MPTKYQTAINAGYSNDEIMKFLQPKINTALSSGYSQEEINEFLGIPTQTTQPVTQPLQQQPIERQSTGIIRSSGLPIQAVEKEPSFAKQLARKWKRSWMRVSKGISKGLGLVTEDYAVNEEINKVIPKALLPLVNPVGAINEYMEKNVELADYAMEQPEYKQLVGMEKYDEAFWKNHNWRKPKYIAMQIADQIPIMAGAISANIVGGGAGSLAFMTALEGGFAYEDLQSVQKDLTKEGIIVSDEELKETAVGIGLVNGLLELASGTPRIAQTIMGKGAGKQVLKTNIKQLIKSGQYKPLIKSVGKFVANATEIGTVEGVTEALQEYTLEIGKLTIGGEELPNALAKVWTQKESREAMLQSGGIGFGMGLGGGAVSPIISPEISEVADEETIQQSKETVESKASEVVKKEIEAKPIEEKKQPVTPVKEKVAVIETKPEKVAEKKDLTALKLKKRATLKVLTQKYEDAKKVGGAIQKAYRLEEDARALGDFAKVKELEKKADELKAKYTEPIKKLKQELKDIVSGKALEVKDEISVTEKPTVDTKEKKVSKVDKPKKIVKTDEDKKLVARGHIIAKKLGYDSKKDKIAYESLLLNISNKKSFDDMSSKQIKRTVDILQGMEQPVTELKETKKDIRKRLDTHEVYTSKSGEGKGIPKIKSVDFSKSIGDDIIKLEKKLDSAKYKGQKVNVPSWVKHGADFVDMAGVVAEATGDKDIFTISKKLNENLHEYQHEYTIRINEITAKHKNSLNKLSEGQLKSLSKYFATGKMDKSLNKQDIKNFIKDMDILREESKPIVRKFRVKQFFEGKLKKESFHKDQYKLLSKWKKEQGENFKEQNKEWNNFLERIEDGTEKGSEKLIRKNYLMEDSKYLEVQMLGENIFSKEDDYVGTGKGFLKAKQKQGIGDENPINKVFASYRRALRLKYMDNSINQANEIFKKNINSADYDLIKTQLKQMIGIRKPLTQTEKSMKNMMGKLYLGSVVSSGLIQTKNRFQSLSNAETLTDLLKTAIMVKSESKIVKKYGEEVRNRIVKEMSEKEALDRLIGNDVSHELTAFKDFKKMFDGQVQISAWVLDTLFNNPLVRLHAKSIGRVMNSWQKSEDMRNRMNGMLLWLDKTQNVLGKDNDWKKIRNKLGFNNLGVSEKLFLEKVYVNQGAGEFAYQFAKMKTMQKQFEYMTSLRSINATRENILVKQFYQYSTWYLGFQKAVTKNLKHAMIKGDRINATKALATMTISGIFTKVMLETLFGTLPDDDDFLKRLGKSAIGYFDPTDYTGSWGASTMLSPINPFYIKGVISGRVSWKFPAEEIALGQSGVLIGQMITSIVNSYQIFFGDKKARENAIKQISNTVNTYGRQTLAPYILIERMLSLYSGSKRINVIRKIAEQTGVEYKPTKIEREWYEQIQFILTGKNPRQVKKKGKTISK